MATGPPRPSTPSTPFRTTPTNPSRNTSPRTWPARHTRNTSVPSLRRITSSRRSARHLRGPFVIARRQLLVEVAHPLEVTGQHVELLSGDDGQEQLGRDAGVDPHPRASERLSGLAG